MTDQHSNYTIHSVNHHFGWDNSNKPILHVRSGTIIEIETLDSSGEQLNMNSTIEDVKMQFGIEIAGLVQDLTDVSKPGDGNRKVRKEIDRAHLADASPAAKTIKLADLIDNSESITRYDSKFAVVYMLEKKLLLEVLREGSPRLHARASEIIRRYYAAWVDEVN